VEQGWQTENGEVRTEGAGIFSDMGLASRISVLLYFDSKYLQTLKRDDSHEALNDPELVPLGFPDPGSLEALIREKPAATSRRAKHWQRLGFLVYWMRWCSGTPDNEDNVLKTQGSCREEDRWKCKSYDRLISTSLDNRISMHSDHTSTLFDYISASLDERQLSVISGESD